MSKGKIGRRSALLAVLFLCLIYSKCFGIDIIVKDCSDKEIRIKDSPFAKHLKNTLIKVIKRSSNCLPTGFATKINNMARSRTITIKLDCDTEDCGWGDPYSATIGISAVAFVLEERNCGCLEAVMLHELLHASDASQDEKTNEGCELNCYEDCAVVSEGVTKKDCCEDKSKK